MADDKDDTGEYSRSLEIRHERFKALGGGNTIHDDLKALGLERLPLGEQITDAHRKLVLDLAAAGLSNQAVADILGISKERTQSLFTRELGIGFELASATLARSLYWGGVAGDHQASVQWLRYHNRSQWKAKQEFGGPNGGPIPVETEDKTARTIVEALIAGMSTDKNLKRPAKERVKEEAKLTKEAPRLTKPSAKVVKRVRQEDDPDAK
jgi:hypothetical protein